MKNKRAKAAIWIILVLVLGLGAVSSANAATLRIISLKCFETEDNKFDEILLKVNANRRVFNRIRNMRDGDVWAINESFFFPNAQVVTVRLYDRDSGPFDHNDYLGGIILESEPTNGERATIFNRDGARYELKYRVDP